MNCTHALVHGCLHMMLMQATAGLRALGAVTAEQILQAVRFL